MKLFQTVAYMSVLGLAAPAIAHDGRPKTPDTPVAKTTQKPTSTPTAPQHSGGTDASGCHTNHSTGVYHCHKPK